jgi:peptidyl-prolyl cis-trans isomerase SurA
MFLIFSGHVSTKKRRLISLFPSDCYLCTAKKMTQSHMKQFFFSWTIAILLAGSLLPACKSSQEIVESMPATEAQSPALLSFDRGVVTKDEFERVYAKNNGGKEVAATHSPEQLQEYLDLYVNFKRKVFEAEDIGLDDTKAFEQEFDSYRKQLAQPYLAAKEVEDRLIEEAYDRSGYKVSASHLLLSVTEDASPTDTLTAYQRISSYRDSIVSGQRNFAEMAEKYSQDPSAKNEGGLGYQGNLGYFSAFDMVYPFETAAFTTPIGEVSQPIRTNFGYHLVKVNDRIKVSGEKRAAHIIIRVGDRYSAKTEDQAKEKIQEIYAQLLKGAAFADLAAQFSDDPGSASKGGDLGTGRLLPEMEDLKLKMEAGDFSEPFTTRFGWHILKITEVEKMNSFEEAKPALKQKIGRDSRAQISRAALLNRIKTENQYEIFPASVDSLKAKVDANFPRGAWRPDTTQAELMNLPLFQLSGGSTIYRVQDFADFYLKNRIRNPRMEVGPAVDAALTAYTEQQLISFEEEQLPKKSPAFRYLLQEYRDGILLFTLMEQKVWKKAMQDTTGLENYYEAHQDSFFANDRLEVTEFRATDEAIMEQVASLLAAGKSDKEIDSTINQASALNLRIATQRYEKGKEELEETTFDQEIGFVSEIIEQGDFFKILRIEEIFPAGIKSFDDAKSEAITRYQDYLEQQWLTELAEKYPVKIDDDVFNNLYK